ncbi:MAG: 3-methyl-2-oxobutanoate hydroxymethyltransferase, partial [Thermodesulfobacteriota bacterium]|nr:3-methyl-2-oxobutanoate hydroxymethyltransferase [Thermodesulfobacteriota bacterium]
NHSNVQTAISRKLTLALEEAGVFCVVLENVTAELGKIVTEKLKVPTIGAGAGPYVDGQSMNLYDILGLSLGTMPRFAKRYINLGEEIPKALGAYIEDVTQGKFPGEENYFHMDEEEWKKLVAALK